jgi:pimeloyl-ACP methyl ester carboxylesterase
MRFFSRAHRCVTYSQRGYPPSDVPTDPGKYGQNLAVDDVIALMDALKIDKAHIVGHSMGALTALLVGVRYPERCLSVTAAGCGYGSSPDAKLVEQTREASRETAKMFETVDFATAAARYADGATRQTHKYKDPRGFAEFARMLAEHSPVGHAMTMREVQAKRPTLWDIQDDLKKFKLPLLVLVGDEDDWCLEASVFIKRMVPTAGLVVIPRSGHTITSEEPAAFNAALADLIANAEAGKWMSHRAP